MYALLHYRSTAYLQPRPCRFAGHRMRTCTKCNETKPDAEFGKKSVARGGGPDSRCKACAKEATAAWAAANPERKKAADAAWRTANPERKKANSAAWYAANSDRVKATAAAWVKANPERAKAVKDAWVVANRDRVRTNWNAWASANPERIKSHHTKWRSANSDRIKAKAANWYAAHYAAHPEMFRIKNHNRRARIRENGGTLSKDLAARLFDLQKGKCACCKKPLGNDYHLDHIMPIVRGGKNVDSNMQLLRAECNLQKHASHPEDHMRRRGYLL